MKNIADVDKFVKLAKQIKSLIVEFSALSKKSPNDAVNKFKIKLINPILNVANYFLSNSNYQPIEDFQLFNEENIPTNSDVLVILSQYNACLEKYFQDNTRYREYKNHWLVNNKVSDMLTSDEYDLI